MARLLPFRARVTTSAPQTPAIELDERAWPVLHIAFTGNASDEEFERYLAKMTSYVRRGTKMATVIDARRAGSTPAVQRRKQARWQEDQRDELVRNVAGTAFVIDSPVVRGVLTAILWLSPLPQPHLVTASMDEAERWVREKLRAAGVTHATP